MLAPRRLILFDIIAVEIWGGSYFWRYLGILPKVAAKKGSAARFLYCMDTPFGSELLICGFRPIMRHIISRHTDIMLCIYGFILTDYGII